MREEGRVFLDAVEITTRKEGRVRLNTRLSPFQQPASVEALDLCAQGQELCRVDIELMAPQRKPARDVRIGEARVLGSVARCWTHRNEVPSRPGDVHPAGAGATVSQSVNATSSSPRYSVFHGARSP